MTGICASCAEATPPTRRCAAGGGGRKAKTNSKVRAKLSELLTRRWRASGRIIAILLQVLLGEHENGLYVEVRRERHTRRAGREGRTPHGRPARAGRFSHPRRRGPPVGV